MKIPISITYKEDKVVDISFEQESEFKNTIAHKQINEYFQGERKTFDFPFEISGTIFQRSIYKALIKIPYGETCTYKELAKMAGYPKAYRAVGNALGNNPLAILIPCHRVLASDGSIGGFTGGISIKKQLLALEKRY